MEFPVKYVFMREIAISKEKKYQYVLFMGSNSALEGRKKKLKKSKMEKAIDNVSPKQLEKWICMDGQAV